MFLFPILILGSMFILTLIIDHLNQSFSNYFDFVALFIVLGGTILVGVISIPWEYKKDLIRVFSFLWKKEGSHYYKILSQAKKLFHRQEFNGNSSFLYDKVFSVGSELLGLGLPKEKVQEILEDLISMEIRRYKRIAFSIKNLAKYPPAFGLIGTVFGLVNLMKKLEGATDASFLGVQMSIALVATMYGLLLANFVINPLGEFILKKCEEEEEYADIALNAILLIAKDEGYLVFLEHTTAMLPESDRKKINFNEFDISA